MTSYLRLLVNPRDELAWKRVLKLIPKIGNATAARVWERLAYAAEPLALIRTDEFAKSLAQRRCPRLAGICSADQRIDCARNAERRPNRSELILNRGYLEYREANYENADAREEDLRQLANFALPV
ncbi:MAG: hypothetical protein U0X75_19165 [Acidobacteriota bacterium]